MRDRAARCLPCVRILRGLGELLSRSRLRPGERLSVWRPLHSVRTPVNSRALWNDFAHHNETQVSGCAPDLWGRLKSQYNHCYICVENFLLIVVVSNWACYCAIVLKGVASGKRSIVYPSPIVRLASPIVVSTTVFPTKLVVTTWNVMPKLFLDSSHQWFTYLLAGTCFCRSTIYRHYTLVAKVSIWSRRVPTLLW